MLLEAGGVMSFGAGEYGKLGHGDGEDQSLPKLIEAAARDGIVEVAAGPCSSVLLGQSGRVRHLGVSGHGQ